MSTFPEPVKEKISLKLNIVKIELPDLGDFPLYSVVSGSWSKN